MGSIHSLPARLRLNALFRKVHRSSVPVLMFHGVMPDAEKSPFNTKGKMISPERMKSFLDRILRIFDVISAEEFVSIILAGKSLSNSILITFDDGYENVYRYAYPILKELGLPFAVFVSTGFVDTDKVLPWDLLNFAVMSTTERLLPAGVLPREIELGSLEAKRAALALLKESLKKESADRVAEHIERICKSLKTRLDAPELLAVRFLKSSEIKEMSGSGVVFGGHTVNHPILSRESSERARSEIRLCKQELESITGKKVSIFAYPNGAIGDFDETTKSELEEAGYLAAFTTIHGLYHPGDDPLEIPRIAVDSRWSSEEFETRCSGLLQAMRRKR